ncbi:MAG TPA: hypothetical protein PLI51_12025, partial [bacterium]|nr:hypothetical protein [bacterium]
MKQPWLSGIVIAVICNVFAAAPPASGGVPVRRAPGDEYWHALGENQDLNGIIYSIVGDGSGAIYAAGSFTQVGAVAANRVARWDGSSWSALGSGATGV